MARQNLPPVPFATYYQDPEEWLRKIAETVRQLVFGRTDAVGDFTCGASSATTTLTDERIGGDSHITFTPLTANAAAEVAAGGFYVSARAKGSATITHANNAQTDRDFTYKVNN